MAIVARLLSEKHRRLTLLVLATVGALAFQGSRGLYEPTEARYAEVAREMVVSGDYMHPTLSGQPHYTKPPLAYWTIAAGLKLAGVNTWGARLGNVFAFVLCVLAFSEISAVVWGERAGLIAGLVFTSSPLPFVGANVVSTDTLLTLWVVLTMLSFVLSYRAQDARARRWWIRAMWVSLALGFMTKGPPALLPLLAIVIFGLVSRRRLGLLDPLGLTLFVVVGFWWYVLVVYQRPELLRYFIGEEIVARNVTAQAHRNSQWYAPVTVYLPTLVAGALPWLVVALRGNGATRPSWRSLRTDGVHRELSGLVTLWWLAVPLAVFCLSKSRLPLYMLQVYPPLALGFVALIHRTHMTTRTLAITTCAALIVLIGVKGWSGRIDNRSDAGRLFAAVEQAGGAQTRLFVVAHGEQHGLEFYSGGKATWIAQDDPDVDAVLDETVARIASQRDAFGSTFIVEPSHTDAVIRALDRADLAYERSRAFGRDLLVCRAPDS